MDLDNASAVADLTAQVDDIKRLMDEEASGQRDYEEGRRPELLTDHQRWMLFDVRYDPDNDEWLMLLGTSTQRRMVVLVGDEFVRPDNDWSAVPEWASVKQGTRGNRDFWLVVNTDDWRWSIENARDRTYPCVHLCRIVYDEVEVFHHGVVFLGRQPTSRTEVELSWPSGASAATDTWSESYSGDTKPAFKYMTREVWDPSAHTLWGFYRTVRFDDNLGIWSVSAETRFAIFTAVPEMP